MVSVQEHYDVHLAPHYMWISGGASAARTRSAELFRELGIAPARPHAAALDLGAGSGFQSLPLAAAGFQVTAIDLSSALLDELSHEASAAGLAIHTVRGDLRAFPQLTPSAAPEVIVCMGDTLTHLDSAEEVSRVVHDAARHLAPGGHLLLSFRDYTVERSGADRFIPVRSESDRIFTCFLEFGTEHVAVHDVVHTNAGGTWQMAVSAYRKLRLDPNLVREALRSAGLSLVHDRQQHGVVTLAARRPQS